MAGPVPFCVFGNDLERGVDSDETCRGYRARRLAVALLNVWKTKYYTKCNGI